MRAPGRRDVSARRRWLRRVLALGAAGVVGTVTGCASAGGATPGPVGELPACFQIQRDAGARVLGLPWGFELRTDPLEGWGNLPDARQALTAVSATERADIVLNYWRMAGDTVQVSHTGGGGFALALLPEGQDLVGTARAIGDVRTVGDTGAGRGPEPVVARRVVCGAV